MRSSFVFLQCAPCTAMSCACIGQTYLLNPSSFSLFRFPLQLSTSGFEASSISRRGTGFRRNISAARARRSPELRRSRPNHDGLQFENQPLRCNRGIGDRKRGYMISTASAKETEFQDYEDEFQLKDLAEAREVVDVLNSFESDAGSSQAARLISSASTSGSLTDIDMETSFIFPETVDGLTALDAYQMASDLTQVEKAYDWLLSKGLLPNFGKAQVKTFDGDRLVTEAVLMDSIGLEASKLSPKKWGLSGKSAMILATGIALFSYIRDTGIDIRPIAALILALGFYDAIYWGGTGLLQISSMWLPYKRRVLVHEAGHVLVAYLLGCPIRGVILDPVQAMKMGIQGQAGTQFWDRTLEMKVLQEGPAGVTVDRYSIVLFAGIAAEALVYGEAQGGESDENLFKSIVGLLQPSWSMAKMSDHARWAVLQAFELLRDHKKAHLAVVRALEQEAGLGSLIRAIEKSMP